MAWGGWAEASAPSLEAVGLIPLFAGIAIGLAFILTGAFQHTEFQRSHPFIQDFYTVEDRQRAQRLFAWLLVAGIVLIFTGIVALASDRGGQRVRSGRKWLPLWMGSLQRACGASSTVL